MTCFFFEPLLNLPFTYHRADRSSSKETKKGFHSYWRKYREFSWCPLRWNQIGVIVFFDLLLSSSSTFFFSQSIFRIYISRLSLCMIIIISNLVRRNGHLFIFHFLTYRVSLNYTLETLISFLFELRIEFIDRSFIFCGFLQKRRSRGWMNWWC